MRPSPPLSFEAGEPLPTNCPGRVWIADPEPLVDDGRWPVKRIVGDALIVRVDVLADGHDVVAGEVRWRHVPDGVDGPWHRTPLRLLANDRFQAVIDLTAIGPWQFVVVGWIDAFATWRRDLHRRVNVGQVVTLELQIGAALVRAAAERATGAAVSTLAAAADRLADATLDQATRVAQAMDESLAVLMADHPDYGREVVYDRILPVWVDRPKACFSTWYECFPRSLGTHDRSGTLRDLERELPSIAAMGFDVLYLPPIHPIGEHYRKGRNNAVTAQPTDPGSPWAVGSAAGGHTAIHPALGTLDDFRHLVATASQCGMEIALDLAFQAAPDHPWVAAHPAWFRHRPDGTIQFAENPPKQYEDIYPFDFLGDDWPALWRELLGVVRFWVDQGVRIFRVDNPHTKPIAFWAWCIAAVHRQCPDVLFLAEAFTRPKLMHVLAKVGFSQSYTYFTWRTTPSEMRTYLIELTTGPEREFFRPNFWPNTPDILPEHLQHGGRPMFISRLVLAATLSGNYGIYGPAFELLADQARPGSEEYQNNEKYEVKHWNRSDPASLTPLITRINRIRRDHPALHGNSGLHFHACDNPQLLCYSKQRGSGSTADIVLVVVSFDPVQRQCGWIELDLAALSIDPGMVFQVHDLIGDARWSWSGSRNYVDLDPRVMPAHIFAIRRAVRRENNFEYYA